jgi:hypothetical protein
VLPVTVTVALTSVMFDTLAMTDRQRSPYRAFCECQNCQEVNRLNDEVFQTPKRQIFQSGQLIHTQRVTLSSHLQLQNRVKRHHFPNLRPDLFAAEVSESLILIHEKHGSDSRDLENAADVANASERLASRGRYDRLGPNNCLCAGLAVIDRSSLAPQTGRSLSRPCAGAS